MSNVQQSLAYLHILLIQQERFGILRAKTAKRVQKAVAGLQVDKVVAEELGVGDGAADTDEVLIRVEEHLNVGLVGSGSEEVREDEEEGSPGED